MILSETACCYRTHESYTTPFTYTLPPFTQTLHTPPLYWYAKEVSP